MGVVLSVLWVIQPRDWLSKNLSDILVDYSHNIQNESFCALFSIWTDIYNLVCIVFWKMIVEWLTYKIVRIVNHNAS